MYKRQGCVWTFETGNRDPLVRDACISLAIFPLEAAQGMSAFYSLKTWLTWQEASAGFVCFHLQNKIMLKFVSQKGPTYLSVCLSVYLFICLSVYLSVCLSVYLSVCLSIHPSIYLFIYPSSTHSSIRFLAHPSISSPNLTSLLLSPK